MPLGLFIVHIWNDLIRGTYWPESGKGYAFWSGPGSDLGEVAILGAVLGAARHLQCHQDHCWRVGRYSHGHLKLCAKHHPLVPNDGRITSAHIDAVTDSKETSS